MISLYPDQEEFITSIRGLWRDNLRIVAYASTGFGKTRVAARIIEGFLSKGLRVCFVVPRISLVAQTEKAFRDLGIEDITFQWADSETNQHALLTISSIDTMIRRDKIDYDLIIIDEAHLRRKKLLEWMDTHPEDRYLGLTATPFAPFLSEHFTAMAKSKSMKWLIENKRLSAYEVYAPTVPNLKGVKIKAGDYVESDLEQVMCGAKIVGDVIQNWLEKGEDRMTMVLAINVAHANFLLIEFQKAGVSSEVITAKVPVEEREVIFQRVRDGITKVLISVDCLTIGFDIPEISCLINARPTKSLMRYIQGMGRVLRYVEGKTAIIFDHAGSSIDLGLPCDIDIDELPTETAKEAKEREKKEAEIKAPSKPKICPSCNFVKNAGVHECPRCKFKPVMGEDELETDRTRGLTKIKGKKQDVTKESKQLFYSQLLGFQKQREMEGKKASDGYIAHLYRGRFDCWPRGLNKKAITPGAEVSGFIKSRQIAYAKLKGKVA